MIDLEQLDESQRAVVSVTPEERQIVLAGPGAGKSEVVGALAAHLVEDGRLYPEEILVVSFSRAAVDVVRKRTSHVTDEGRGVDVATIDSLAGRVVHDSADEQPFRGFDAQIRRATALLADGATTFEDYRHVIVDEMQDVLGDRARFVTAILDSLPEGCGFTLLGDPLQTIYQFQLGDAALDEDNQLIELARREYSPLERALTGEYRSRTEDARRVAAARDRLLGSSPSDRFVEVERLTADLAPLGQLNNAVVDEIGAWRGTTVLLTDTNIRAALVAQQLHEHGLRSERAAALADPAIPAWVAQLLADAPGRLEREEFLRRAEALGLEEASVKWRALLRLAGGKSDLEVGELARRLSGRGVPRVLQRVPDAHLLVSTVHRAKGLEFDNVVLVDPEDWHLDRKDQEAAACHRFVALSRARGRLTRTRGVVTRRWRQETKNHQNLWVRRGWKGRGVTGLLIEPSYARALGPVDDDLTTAVGEPVKWRRADDLIDAEGSLVPSWEAQVAGRAAARTGEWFGRTLSAHSYGKLPDLVGGHVEGVETVIGPPRDSGPGRNGLWLSARVSGPLKLDWYSEEA